MKTAILVDGGFYRKRAYACIGDRSPKDRADELFEYCLRHLSSKQGKSDLYRIFYYDCEPMDKKIYHPLLDRTIDFSKTDIYKWTFEFFKELTCKRKVALRLGKLASRQAHFQLKQSVLKDLCKGKRIFDELTEQDFVLSVPQKGVDMKIGLDISSLAFKKQVKQIVLISGDSDFVSAAKHARREGIDFILDNLGNPITDDLNEHIDGLITRDECYKKRNT